MTKNTESKMNCIVIVSTSWTVGQQRQYQRIKHFSLPMDLESLRTAELKEAFNEFDKAWFSLYCSDDSRVKMK